MLVVLDVLASAACGATYLLMLLGAIAAGLLPRRRGATESTPSGTASTVPRQRVAPDWGASLPERRNVPPPHEWTCMGDGR
ncbi:hypothetical protein [Micromonospora sp. NPDC050276]|uniref:hypothetical protein n=1 Tax=Micromonospora sp. NPDC050276 TaxID=3364278 RepID=UPI0037998A97